MTQTYLSMSDGIAQLAYAKPAKPDARWVGSTVTVNDESRRYNFSDASLTQQIQRATQWVMICAQINARECARVRLRLYRKARSTKKTGKGFRRVTNRKALAYMRGLAGKAAEYANDADEIEEVQEHPIIDLMRRPNPYRTGFQFTLARFLDKELCGNSFRLMVGESDPTQMYRLAPQWTVVLPDRTQFVRGYRYTRDGVNAVDFPKSEVDHDILYPSVFSPYLGMSWIQAVLMDADRYAASTETDLNRQKNSGRPDWMLQVPPQTTPDQITELIERTNARFRGPSKSAEFLVSTVEEVKPLNWTPKDLEAVASRSDAKQLIQAAAGVPEAIFAMNDANRASAMTALVQYSRLTTLGRLTADQDELNYSLLTRFGLLPGDYWLCYDNCVPDDEAAIVTQNTTLVSSGQRTLDEVRAEDGYEPYDDGIGELPRINGILIAATESPEGATDPTDSQETPASGVTPTGTPALAGAGGDVQATALNGAQVTALQGMLQSVADGLLPLESARAAIAASFPALTTEQIDSMVNPLAGFETAKPQDNGNANNGTGGGDGGQANASDTVTPANDGGNGAGPKARLPGKAAGHSGDYPAYAHDTKTIVETLTPEQAKVAKEIEKDLRPWYEGIASAVRGGSTIEDAMKGAAGELERILTDTLSRAMLDAASAASQTTGGGSFDVLPQTALSYLESYVPKLSVEISSNTADMLRGAVADGAAQGMSIGQIQERVAAALGDETNYRAERIARTEVQHVFGQGELHAWKALGVAKKDWLLSPTACPVCTDIKARNPAAIPIDQPFFQGNGWQDGQTVPAHPNCTCTVVPVQDGSEL